MGVVVAALCLLTLAPAARAEDFLSALFGAFGARPPAPAIRLPYADEGGPGIQVNPFAPPPQAPRPRVGAYGGSQAFCVRTCDGRYFPANGSNDRSRAASCDSLCPACKTLVMYGSDIDHAVTLSGKRYSALPNAFRYRNELVAGCTCNGKDQVGLARIKIEDDPTLRKGDLVAGADGLMVAGRGADRRSASLNFSPASKAIQARYQRVPVMAAE